MIQIKPVSLSVLVFCSLLLSFPLHAQLSSSEEQTSLGPSSTFPLLEEFSLDGSKNILKEDDFGIINGKITLRVNYPSVATVSGIWAPPYVASNFNLVVRFFGEEVKTEHYKWYPMEVQRSSTIQDVKINTYTALVPGTRAAIMKFILTNPTEKDISVPVQFKVRGGVDYKEIWGFERPSTSKSSPVIADGNSLTIKGDDGNIAIATNIPGFSWFDLASHWDTHFTLSAGESKTYYVAFAIGAKEDPVTTCKTILDNPEQTLINARTDYSARLEDLFTKLPKFSASDKRLEAYYNRSVESYLINKWNVDEFILHPYYGTGAIMGGCVANYLWDFGMAAELFPLYDPQAAKAHIKQFLNINIYEHFLFDPVKGLAAGPWYPANQDKIIELIYFYVMHTGDFGFLKDSVNGMTVLDHVIKNATFGDPGPDQPQQLYDYGVKGEHHLELRRGFPYHGIMPDLNGRRYLNYLKAYELTQIDGHPLSYLPERADSLKKLLKNELWSSQDKWFYFETDGKKSLRWTSILYMLIGSPVLDTEEREGLISHLNEKEFLGDYGMHSISKLDPAFDEVDIDHGGGGSYIAFPPLIAQQLYNSGYPQAADDLLNRHLWIGERLPYWGDSHPANYIGYREDTPLKSAFDASAGAQCIIFGLFGVQVAANGDITVNPHVPSFSPQISLQGLKIRGVNMDITANESKFTVKVGRKKFSSKIGSPIVYKKRS